MLRGATLAVVAVCLGCVCHCLQAELMSQLVVPRDYGVKLCGREFIRAVIFTCGGSRWRRSAEISTGESTTRSLLQFILALTIQKKQNQDIEN